jgi:hypothetical protein
MATLTQVQVCLQYSNGEADRVALYALRKVSTGDTYDLATEFSSPRQAIVIGTTAQMAFTAAIAGSVITIPAGLSSDAGWLLVWGTHA